MSGYGKESLSMDIQVLITSLIIFHHSRLFKMSARFIFTSKKSTLFKIDSPLNYKKLPTLSKIPTPFTLLIYRQLQLPTAPVTANPYFPEELA